MPTLESESVELHALELEVLFIAICTAILVLKILGGGWLNPNLSLFAGGWDAVVTDGFGVEGVEDAVAVLVDAFGTGVGGVEDWLAGGRGRLGVENWVGVSFIRTEVATEATVVSIDSSSMSSVSNDSTIEISAETSATDLKGVRDLGSVLVK